MNKRPTVLDLFAGCGGMSLGMEAAGFDIACSVEFDPVHSIVHHYNFPYGATICRDVSLVSAKDIKKKMLQKGYEKIDVIVGGPPCQGFSHIGKRQLDDDRNKLVFEFVRLVSELNPKYFVFENVPGIASGKHKKFLAELLERFNDIGYSVTSPYKVLDASHFGVAQARKRLILIGSRKDVAKVGYPNPSHEKENKISDLFDCEREGIVGAHEAICDLEDIPVFIGDDYGLECQEYRNGYSRNFALIPSGEFSNCHVRYSDGRIYNHVGSSHTAKSIARFRDTECGKTESISRFFKLHPNLPCNTLRAGTNSDHGAHTAPRPIHYKHPRCISVREGARLHSFPDWFQFNRTIWHGFREIGNAVAPLVGKAIGNEIIKGLSVDVSQLPIYKLDSQDESLLKMSLTAASVFWGVDRGVIPVRKRLTNE
jgi:DNA (cytosine-5)-methyltransferase 1